MFKSAKGWSFRAKELGALFFNYEFALWGEAVPPVGTKSNYRSKCSLSISIDTLGFFFLENICFQNIIAFEFYALKHKYWLHQQIWRYMVSYYCWLALAFARLQ